MNRFLQPCVFAAMLLVASIVLTSCVTPPPSYDTLKQDLMLPGVEPAPAPIIDKQDLPTSAETAEEMAPAKAALPDSMSLLDAKRIALADNPDLRSIGHRITSAQARYRRALASYWPSLDLSAGAEHVHRVPQTQVFGGNTIDSGSDSYETYRATLTLSWLLFDGLAREYRVMQARYQETSLQASRADAQRLLCKAVSQSYLTALQARKSMEISRTDRTFNQRLLHDAYASHVVLCALATSHRNVSLVNFGLVRSLPATPEYNSLTPPTVEVIGDGLHVDPLTISALLAARETRDVAFITGAAASRLV